MTQCSGWQSPGWSNPNLLVNWDFRNPVNQRGQKSYAQNGYTIDMLKTDSYLVLVDVEDGYIRITNGLQYNYIIGFAIENTSALIGQNITFSMKKGSGEIVTSTVKSYTEGTSYFGQFARIEENMVKISVPVGGILDIQAVKLEVGSISTLALDLMQPSDHVAELRKCKRYLQVFQDIIYTTEISYLGTEVITFMIPFEYPMRISPTFDCSGFSIQTLKGEEQEGFALEKEFTIEGKMSLLARKTNHGLGADNVRLKLLKGTILSAEL